MKIWNYNDNVNSPMMREWLSSNPVTIEDGLRHDKWCRNDVSAPEGTV